MPSKDPLVYVMHIRDCCEQILKYSAEGGPDWSSNRLFVDAVCRNIAIIGDAGRRLDDSFRLAHPEIPWAGIFGARNVVIHTYDHLKLELIRSIVEKDVPELLITVRRLLGESPG